MKKDLIIHGGILIILVTVFLIFLLKEDKKSVEIIGPSELVLHEGREFDVIEVRSTWYNHKDNSVYLKSGDSIYLLQNIPESMYNELASGKTIIIK